MTEAGEAFDAAETEQREAQEAMYFGKRSAPVSGEAEKKRAKKAEREPRLASLDIANAWQNMLMQHYGQHFGDFAEANTKVLVLVLDDQSFSKRDICKCPRPPGKCKRWLCGSVCSHIHVLISFELAGNPSFIGQRNCDIVRIRVAI